MLIDLGLHKDGFEKKDKSYLLALRTARVVLLEGLLLIMGIVLGVFIIVVRIPSQQLVDAVHHT